MSNREQIVVEKIGNFFIEAEITDLQDLSGTVQGILDELKNSRQTSLNLDVR